MRLLMCPIASGSSGNCTYIVLNGTRLLVDAGISCARICSGLAQIGTTPEELHGILITHEHVDHIKGLTVFCRRHEIPIYANAGTWEGMEEKRVEVPDKLKRVFETDEEFFLDKVSVRPFAIPHDAREPVGFVISASPLSCAVATDIGHISDRWIDPILGSQAVLLESNHDVNMVKSGSYPASLKRRILSNKGHLNNLDAGAVLARLVRNGTQAAFLGHLSGENNLPELAYNQVTEVLSQESIRVDRDVRIMVARRERISDMIVFSTDG